MAEITTLSTLAKASATTDDYILVANSSTKTAKRFQLLALFPSVAHAGGVTSETLYNSATLTNQNQIQFKGIKSGDTGLLTVATTSSNIVLTALEAGIDLSLCNNVTSGFITGVDFTGTISGENPVMLTSPAIRPFVRSIVERFRPETEIMSQNEIHPKAKIKTLGQI